MNNKSKFATNLFLKLEKPRGYSDSNLELVILLTHSYFIQQEMRRGYISYCLLLGQSCLPSSSTIAPLDHTFIIDLLLLLIDEGF